MGVGERAIDKAHITYTWGWVKQIILQALIRMYCTWHVQLEEPNLSQNK